MSIEIPSAFQLDQKVQVVFPNNGKLQGKVVKISFTNYGKVLYDVEIPFASGPDGEPEPAGHFRIHGVDNWFISHTQEDWDKMRAEEKAANRQPTHMELAKLALQQLQCGEVEAAEEILKQATA